LPDVGPLIHIMLVITVIILVTWLLTGRKLLNSHFFLLNLNPNQRVRLGHLSNVSHN